MTLPGPTTPAPVLALDAVTKAFGPIEILHGVDFALHPGEVHALIGENGAGKSTTMKILAGYLDPTGGRVLLEGAPVTFVGSDEAEDRGIIMIHQEFNLAEHLSVDQNVFLGRELRRGFLLDHRAMRARTADLLAQLHCRVDPATPVNRLSVPDKQMVEIAKALSRDARVLIMDEPTAVLTERETEVLFAQIARLRAEGVAILYTSHKLGEVKRIADRVTVLRDGTMVRSDLTADVTEDDMAAAMVGRELSDLYPPKVPAQVGGGAEPILEARGITVPGIVHDASLVLHRGEVLGIGGLVGSGRTELAEAIAGLRPRTGSVRLDGVDLPAGQVAQAMRAGLAYLTEDRKGAGLLLDKSLRENLTLPLLETFGRPLIDRRREEAALDRAIAEFGIRAPARDMAVGDLSGGNQQKLLLAKVLLPDPRVVIIDEPTRGIDIGTKQQIYTLIARLAAEGRSIIVISSEMPELIGLASRVIVMHAGRIAGELSGTAVTEGGIVRLAMGMDDTYKDTAA
ncbi:sugar ABC transporter ATP-binding protein (plasmid) [Paracoccus liaowanqingii]|uniref:Sugar ABC transporter ATP-binding protein n=1 Tax=Paracoccus liaowanqingii TaxID=2560053 RepID=A0A4P7HME9_9RHOB|nr:sugar ABC transporter ATP-binding protein [Paracoccus liaowanqingii]QBX35365.1 sugar ABC transporter ATP-binding protein [Paracoccus liaowanqingii]QDA36745.1 sugar ABC transporter ATP-binding protein [Paracoccus liaowanqingii]